ncbi:hypothetical protein K2173_028170 [Erythroxylum novogranatense]|uniref:Uncharacterized protein n=1 Tax=Erythroxylum novogranatense TaxID=1862640 RepID=A0AAV8U1C8_9ROSI|nr:hypothetical protein K2173_028170 [Erythroxylum novogranatense]
MSVNSRMDNKTMSKTNTESIFTFMEKNGDQSHGKAQEVSDDSPKEANVLPPLIGATFTYIPDKGSTSKGQASNMGGVFHTTRPPNIVGNTEGTMEFDTVNNQMNDVDIALDIEDNSMEANVLAEQNHMVIAN